MASTLDVNIINPFIESTDNLFTVMMNMKVNRGMPYIREDVKNSFYFISGIIGLAGEASGCVVVSFPTNVALRVVSKFIGEEITEMNDDVKDAIGELVNIIAGGAKQNPFGGRSGTDSRHIGEAASQQNEATRCALFDPPSIGRKIRRCLPVEQLGPTVAFWRSHRLARFLRG